MTQMAGFRVAEVSTCNHNGHYSTTVLEQTVGGVSGPHCQTEAFYWHHFTSHEVTCSSKSTLEQLTITSGGSEPALIVI